MRATITRFVRHCVSGVIPLLLMINPLFSRVTAVAAAVSFFSTPSAFAAETVRKPYDFPRGDASDTLKRFAEDSGQQVVYLLDTVRGVATNAVKGEFTAREALAALLANTGLTLVEDRKSGALMVNRVARDLGGKTIPRRAGPTAFLAAWLALIMAPTHPTHAADGAPLTGVVQGRVENAASGNYIGNVRVAVSGGGPESLTNGYGEYRLDQVPLGTHTLVASISGYVTKSIPVTVATDPVTANFSLAAADAARRDAKETVVLEAFVVDSQRTMSGSSVAINERRTA